MESSSVSNPSKIQSLLSRSPDSIINTVESDDDSGIVTVANGQRIGSTSSHSDEDHNTKDKVSQPPLQSSSGSKHRVRFDDELHLSEQNMRRSCRKLFDTLFHQKDNYEDDSNMISQDSNDSNINKNSLLPSCHCHYFTQTLPHKKPSQSFKSMANCRTSSELHLNSNMTQDLSNNDKSPQNKGGFLLQTVSHLGRNERHECPCDEVKQMDSIRSRLQQTKSHSFWSIDTKFEGNDKHGFDCSAALTRINNMTDRLESSSMVNAFARPVLIHNSELSKHKEPIYETIFPINKRDDRNVYSSKIQIEKWLNNENIDNERKKDETENEKNDNLNTNLKSESAYSTKSFSRKSILKVLPNEMPDISRSSFDLSNKAMISPDQYYPVRDDFEIDSFKQKNVEYASVIKDKRSFFNSYSAGDDIEHKLVTKALESAISETNLHQNISNRKSLLQRFKSAITRAFTSEKSTKQYVFEPNKDNKIISQTDLRINNKPNSNSNCETILKSSIEKSPSFVKNLKTRISIRRNTKVDGESPQRRIQLNGRLISIDKQIVSTAQLSDSFEHNESIQVWGELIKLNSDSSQVIQIHRKKGKAFGFFVARGTVNNVKGVFVSRMKDEQIQKSLMGVLEIGDEILAIDGQCVKDANIMQVNQLIANKQTIRLTIIPYMNNK